MANMEVEKMVKKALNNMIIDYPFFATLALQLPLVEKPDNYPCPTACTDGNRIVYNPEFFKNLDIGTSLAILIHEVLHCALGHLWRRGTRDVELWNCATDFAINSIIKDTIDSMSKENKNSMVKPLVLPRNCLYDEKFRNMNADEIYTILLKNAKKNKKSGTGSGQGGQNHDNQSGNGNGGNNNNNSNSGSSNSDNNQNGNGKNKQNSGQGQGSNSKITVNGKTYNMPNNHDSWEKADKMTDAQKNEQKVKWDAAMLSAAEAAKAAGNLPAGMQRGISDIKNPQKDWRMLLQEFIQEEYNDYSLMPPDKRYQGDFFMFDFNDTIEVVNDILFFIDTSGSMGEKAINMCFSEIQGAINQFEKNLHGKLFFFDYDVAKEHYDFDDVNGNVSDLAVFGGGGTSFKCVFDYIRNHREEFNNINGVIILTDGYCDYPNEEDTDGIPTLWIYTTPEVERGNSAPFGRTAVLDESQFDEE